MMISPYKCLLTKTSVPCIFARDVCFYVLFYNVVIS